MKKDSFKFVVALLTISFGILAGIVVASRIVSSPASGDGVKILKLSHGLDTKHPVHLGMVEMQNVLKTISSGKMGIQIYSGGQLGGEREVIEQMQLGALGMCKSSAASMENFCPIMGVFSMPYIFRDRDHYWKVLDGPIGKKLLDASNTPKIGLKGLCYYDSGARSFYLPKDMIKSPADLVGKKIRVMKSKTSMNMIKAMGGIPTPLSWGELYTALQQGLVDGAENNPPSFLTSRHCEIAKNYALDEHARIPDMLMISSKVWDALTVEQQGWLQSAADASSLFQRKLWKKMTAEALATVQQMDKPVTVYHPDKQPFIDAVKPMIEATKGTPIGDLIDQIKKK